MKYFSNRLHLPSKLESTFVPVCVSKLAPPYWTRHDAKARRHCVLEPAKDGGTQFYDEVTHQSKVLESSLIT